MVNDFEELAIYQQSRELAKQIYVYTKKAPFKYDIRFVQQIRAAAGSISDNIAEGFERQGNKEFLQFLYISKGSCGEVRAQLNRAFDAEFIDKETYERLYGQCKQLGAGIIHFIQKIKSFESKGSKYEG